MITKSITEVYSHRGQLALQKSKDLQALRQEKENESIVDPTQFWYEDVRSRHSSFGAWRVLVDYPSEAQPQTRPNPTRALILML